MKKNLILFALCVFGVNALQAQIETEISRTTEIIHCQVRAIGKTPLSEFKNTVYPIILGVSQFRDHMDAPTQSNPNKLITQLPAYEITRSGSIMRFEEIYNFGLGRN